MILVQEKGKIPNRDRSFNKSINFLIKFANCLGLLPLSDRSPKIKFVWKSWKGMYTILICGVFLGNTIIAIIDWTSVKFSFRLLVRQVNQIIAFTCILLYSRLAQKWPKFAKLWDEVDWKMSMAYGYSENFDLRIRLCSLLTLILTLAECFLLLVYQLSKNEVVDIRSYYLVQFPEFFALLPFNSLTAFFATMTNLIGHMIWSFNDLFIVVISSALALRFKQITDRLYSDEKKSNSNSYWIEIRADYNRLVHLARKLDKYISYVVLLSYSANVFFLLIQLSNVVGRLNYGMQIIYYTYSFFFLVVRLSAVSLYGAWIVDESKEPANCLNAVPSATYNLEIRRLLLQVSFSDVGITGNNMFKVTRGLLLHVAGAIVTYELVLVQFNNSEGLQ